MRLSIIFLVPALLKQITTANAETIKADLDDAEPNLNAHHLNSKPANDRLSTMQLFNALSNNKEPGGAGLGNANPVNAKLSNKIPARPNAIDENTLDANPSNARSYNENPINSKPVKTDSANRNPTKVSYMKCLQICAGVIDEYSSTRSLCDAVSRSPRICSEYTPNQFFRRCQRACGPLGWANSEHTEEARKRELSEIVLGRKDRSCCKMGDVFYCPDADVHTENERTSLKMRLSSFFALLATILIPVQAGPIAYAACQSGCAAVVMACYAAGGATWGATMGATAPVTIIACNAAFGTCSATCASVALLAPTP